VKAVDGRGTCEVLGVSGGSAELTPGHQQFPAGSTKPGHSRVAHSITGPPQINVTAIQQLMQKAKGNIVNGANI
jgi:hypothetical protein